MPNSDELNKLKNICNIDVAQFEEAARSMEALKKQFAESAINFKDFQINLPELNVAKNVMGNMNIGINESFAQSFKAMHETSEMLSKSFKSLYDTSAILSESFKPMFEASEGLSKAFRGMAFGGLSSAEFLRAVRSFEEDGKTWDLIEEYLISLGWFPSGDWSVINGRHLLKLIKQKNNKAIDKYMLNYYSKKRILRIGVKWSNNKRLRKNRRKVLKSIVFAHGIRKYDLAIISILPQMEGIIRERVGRARHRHRYKELMRQYFSKVSSESDKQILKSAIVKCIQDVLINNLFPSYKSSAKSRKVDFTRHTVLHGINVKDFNRINSIKMILLTDYVIHNDIHI